jgi:hypothetical protein
MAKKKANPQVSILHNICAGATCSPQKKEFEHIFGADRPKKKKTAKKKNPQDSTLRNVRAGIKRTELLIRLYLNVNKKVIALERVIYGSKVNTKKT